MILIISWMFDKMKPPRNTVVLQTRTTFLVGNVRYGKFQKPTVKYTILTAIFDIKALIYIYLLFAKNLDHKTKISFHI